MGPQAGQQSKILESPADIGVFGGAAGGGKTFGLMLDGARWLNDPRSNPTFFRLTRPEITQPKGAWDKSEQIFYPLGGVPNLQRLEWFFPATGAKFHFAHLQHDSDVENLKSAEMPLILMDQGESFSAKKFWGLLSRNRGEAPFVPYMRIGCNPDPDSWLAEFIAWWIDADTGFPVPERDGVLRWFVRHREELVWADDPGPLWKYVTEPGDRPLSVTFVRSLLEDNPALMASDPSYAARIAKLPFVEQMRLGKGNWKVKLGVGMFRRHNFLVRDDSPREGRRICYWDTAGTEEWEVGGEDAAFTCGVLTCRNTWGDWVEHVERVRAAGRGRDEAVIGTAALLRERYGHVVHWFEREPGGSGKTDAHYNVAMLTQRGYEAYEEPASGNKVLRARAYAAAVENHQVHVLARPWTESFLSNHEAFPVGKFKDEVDAASGAFNKQNEVPPVEGTGIHRTARPSVVGSLPPNTFR